MAKEYFIHIFKYIFESHWGGCGYVFKFQWVFFVEERNKTNAQ